MSKEICSMFLAVKKQYELRGFSDQESVDNCKR